MKFLVKEHKSIVRLFDELSIPSTDYSFRKKGGQLFIDMKGKDDSFCFYRKKESALNKQLQFEDKITYHLGRKKDIQFDKWEDVLTELKAWMQT